MPRESKRSSFRFGYMLTFLLTLLLAALAVLLLIPSYREYRKQKQLEAEKLRERDAVQTLRLEKMRENNELRTSPEAVERIARIVYRLVRPGERVRTYREPEPNK